MVSLNKQNSHQLRLSLGPKVMFCLLKYRWITFKKAAKCYSINFAFYDAILCNLIKRKNTYVIHMTKVTKVELNIYTVGLSVSLVCPE